MGVKKIKSVTVKDIAREANVSVTTVSLALKDEVSPRVSLETRRRILAIAERLRYRPNYIARSLVTKRTNTIGLFITTLLNPFYAELSQDIIDRAGEKSYNVFTCLVHRGTQAEQIDDLINRGVDGLIICSVTRRDPVIQVLRDRGIPFVLAMRQIEEIPGQPPVNCVVVDNQRGAFMATEHLINLGHTRVGLITGPDDVSTAHDRRQGFLAALAAHGLEADPDLIVTGDFLRASGAACTRELLQRRRRPTAIFVVNDFMAVGALDALREAGLAAPQDVALVGFDDIELASLPGIDLTTISQKKATLGRLAFECLLENISGDADRLAKRIILDPILVIRRTCGHYLKNPELSPGG